MVEKITDPLTHLVRNSCDHGIELPAERLAKGKPEHGTLTLVASHQGGSIVIEVSDDGAGLDRLLHAPNTLATRRQIRDWVMDALGRWERRILLDRVEVLEVPDKPADLRVEIAYRLARTGTPAALAVTVRLEEG